MAEGQAVAEMCRVLPKGEQVSSTFSIIEVREVDLDGDGQADDRISIRERSVTHCGAIGKDEILDQLRRDFGNYTSMTQSPGGMTVVGSFWRASVAWDGRSTTISTRGAVPLPASVEGMALKTQRADQAVKVGDPISTADGRVYFVIGFDLSEAVQFDGTNVTTDPGAIRLGVITKEGMLALRGAKDPREAARLTQEHGKRLSPSEVASVLDRKRYPEVYGRPRG